MSSDNGQVAGSGPWRSASPPAGFQPFPDDAVLGSVGDRLARVASELPDNVAISSPSSTMTYAELFDRVQRAAAAISDRVGPTAEPVAVLADHDGPLVVAVLSVVLAGHVVVVLDPAAPDDASDHVLTESGARLLIHDAPSSVAANTVVSRHPDLAAWPLDEIDAEPGDLPVRSSGDPLMLAFTSGTTGSPKGAIITHGVILNLVRGATNALGVTPADRMPMLFPVSMAVAAYPMFIPLLNGATLATLDVRGVGLAPVPEFLVRERITLAYMAPTVVRFLVDAVAGYTFPELRMIALGGEVVDAPVVQLTSELFAPDLMANGFGTTETGVITLHVFDPADPPVGAVPSGHAVPDVELHVLDDDGAPLPRNASGEVAISSPHVFLGYWGHEDLSGQVLAEDPSGRPGWRLYRTGDLGFIDDDGALVVTGRLDTKVKVRGRFVVLSDVEAMIHALDEVADVVVVPQSESGIVELVAVVVPSSSGVTGADLRARLLSDHEAFRVPSRWMMAEGLPRLPNGKVDRRGVADLVGPGPVPTPDAPPAAPIDQTTDLQRELRSIWESLLPTGIIGLDDDFEVLGGDSLRAAQMLVMVEHRLGVRVPMGELVGARTLRELTVVIERLRSRSADSTVACVQVGDPDRPRLWFVPDLQGSAYRVRHLARHLGADQPVWSFESPLLAGEPNSYRTLDDFAARLVADLLVAQPEGPYWLSGYSFGGICAYEMARQLRASGHEVELLAVVDVGPGYRGPNWREHIVPFRPWFGVERPPSTDAPVRDQLEHYRRMVRRSPRGAARHMLVRSGLYRPFDAARFRVDLWRHGRVRPEWRLWYAWNEHWKLGVRRWDRSSTYAGRMDLLWASQTGSVDSTMGWGDLVADLSVHRFRGFHDDLLEERGAPALGEALRTVIDSRLSRG